LAQFIFRCGHIRGCWPAFGEVRRPTALQQGSTERVARSSQPRSDIPPDPPPDRDRHDQHASDAPRRTVRSQRRTARRYLRDEKVADCLGDRLGDNPAEIAATPTHLAGRNSAATGPPVAPWSGWHGSSQRAPWNADRTGQCCGRPSGLRGLATPAVVSSFRAEDQLRASRAYAVRRGRRSARPSNEPE
jgi:hypothetical protein